MPSVGSLVTDLLSSHNDLCCDKNTVALPTQTEEKALRINDFIVQQKERYLIPRIIVISITMLFAATNSGVPSLSLDCPRASCQELRCSRVPFLFLILQFLLIKNFPIKLHMRMRQV